MGDKSVSSSSEAKKTALPLHPAYSVTNIQTKIRTLDGTSFTYGSWTKLFKLHAKAYKVSQHIDGTPPPAEDSDEFTEWSELDSLVLQWIYSTISGTLLNRVLANEATARSVWLKLESIFLNNKRARATALQQQFTNCLLTSFSSMEEYCEKLKNLADQLADVDVPVDEATLVLQLVRGLPPEYNVVGAIINQGTPTWDEALTQIDLEQQRLTAQKQNSHTVLAATNDKPNNGRGASGSTMHANQNYSGYNSNRGRGQYARGRGRSQRGRGRSYGQQYSGQWPSYWQPGYSPPPSPYPTQAHHRFPMGWPGYSTQFMPPPSAQQQQAANLAAAHSAQYAASLNNIHSPGPSPSASPTAGSNPPLASGPYDQFAGFSDCSPTDLARAMQQAHLNGSDPWVMDSGATSYLTKDPGFPEWSPTFPPQ